MKTSISFKQTVALGLGCVVTILLAAQTALSAPDPKPLTPPGKFVPAQLEGKIVALDKSARLLTVDIKGTLIKINMTSKVKISKKGKATTFEQLAPGQSILISFIELPNGRIEVAALAVEPSSEPVEAAGSKSGGAKGTQVNNSYWGNAPYGLPNPANINGQGISKHK